MNNAIAKFEKISLTQFKTDWIKSFGQVSDEELLAIYDGIKLPKRATSGSAGYDINAPESVFLHPGEVLKIPTGIKCMINTGWVMAITPRSGTGFKYGLRLTNTIGIIDSDYFYSDNEGHIFVKLINDSSIGKDVYIKKGNGIAQAIFLPYGITIDDTADGIRNGGFGSTDK